jgi:hypothetical protein
MHHRVLVRKPLKTAWLNDQQLALHPTNEQGEIGASAPL